MPADAKRPREEDQSDQEHAPSDSGRHASAQAGPSTSTRHAKPSSDKKKRKSSTPSPGIVYISRVPPGMTPQKVKHLMARWGEVGRVYAQKRDGELSSCPVS